MAVTNGIHQHQQGIVVAVRRDADHVQEVAGGFTFGPQTLFSARVLVTLPDS